MTQAQATIAIPTYNRAHYLVLAIESVLAQTNPNWLLLIGDDGSTDETPQLIQRYLDDPRIHYLPNEHNLGYVATMGKLTGELETPYVTYLSDDDLLHPRWLEVFALALDRHPGAVLAAPSARIIDSDGNLFFTPARRLEKDYVLIPGREMFGNFVMGGYMTGPIGAEFRKLPTVFPGTLYRVDAIRKIGGFEPDVLFATDTLIEAKLCLVGNAVYVDVPLVDFRNHEHISSRYGSKALHLLEFENYMRSLSDFMRRHEVPETNQIEQYVRDSIAAHVLSVSGSTLRVAARYEGSYRERIAKIWEYYRWAINLKPSLRWRPETWLVMTASILIPQALFMRLTNLYWAIRHWQERRATHQPLSIAADSPS